MQPSCITVRPLAMASLTTRPLQGHYSLISPQGPLWRPCLVERSMSPRREPATKCDRQDDTAAKFSIHCWYQRASVPIDSRTSNSPMPIGTAQYPPTSCYKSIPCWKRQQPTASEKHTSLNLTPKPMRFCRFQVLPTFSKYLLFFHCFAMNREHLSISTNLSRSFSI